MVAAGVVVMGISRICKSDFLRQSCWSEQNKTKNVVQLEVYAAWGGARYRCVNSTFLWI